MGLRADIIAVNAAIDTHLTEGERLLSKASKLIQDRTLPNAAEAYVAGAGMLAALATAHFTAATAYAAVRPEA